MFFVYRDITGKSPDSNQYEVFIKEISVGIVIKEDAGWLALRLGSNTYEDKTFIHKTDAAKHLAELAKIDEDN